MSSASSATSLTEPDESLSNTLPINFMRPNGEIGKFKDHHRNVRTGKKNYNHDAFALILHQECDPVISQM